MKYNLITKEFNDITYNDILQIKKRQLQHLYILQSHNPIHLYAKINSEKNTFYIVHNKNEKGDIRLQHTGRECSTLTKNTLISILNTLNINHSQYTLKNLLQINTHMDDSEHYNLPEEILWIYCV